MATQEQSPVITPEEAKNRMRAKGWSDRTAAKALGCTPVHLSYVLNGHRQSRRLLERVEALPVRVKEAVVAS